MKYARSLAFTLCTILAIASLAGAQAVPSISNSSPGGDTSFGSGVFLANAYNYTGAQLYSGNAATGAASITVRAGCDRSTGFAQRPALRGRRADHHLGLHAGTGDSDCCVGLLSLAGHEPGRRSGGLHHHGDLRSHSMAPERRSSPRPTDSLKPRSIAPQLGRRTVRRRSRLEARAQHDLHQLLCQSGRRVRGALALCPGFLRGPAERQPDLLERAATGWNLPRRAFDADRNNCGLRHQRRERYRRRLHRRFDLSRLHRLRRRGWPGWSVLF